MLDRRRDSAGQTLHVERGQGVPGQLAGRLDDELGALHQRSNLLPAVAARGDANELVAAMVATAELTRNGFRAGDISTVMSPRTIVSWAENLSIFGDVARAFRLSFLNKCDDSEVSIVAEYYQRAFGTDLDLG